jgi:hypothetical protein
MIVYSFRRADPTFPVTAGPACSPIPFARAAQLGIPTALTVGATSAAASIVEPP